MSDTADHGWMKHRVTSDTPNPGQGWRLLKEGEVIQQNDEIHFGSWGGIGAAVGKPYDAGGYPVRRRIDDGWIKLKDKPAEFPCWIYNGQGVAYANSYTERFGGHYITHWMKGEKPDPPAPEVDEQRKKDDWHFDQWCLTSNHHEVYSKSVAKEAWHAACAYVRNQEDMKKDNPSADSAG